ncbi:MAG TPA: glycosyltransferase family 2 protein [Propionibacteriaceae bacterium]
MTVDVLFPYYGDVTLMKEAVRSVLRQSYGDFRLIVVDDGYPDPSIPGWFESLGDSRISYERNETNLGANANYMKCLGKATNELLVVMGADDVMLPNHLEWLVDRAQRFPEADMFQPGVFVIDQNSAPSNTMVERAKEHYRPKGTGPRLISGEDAAVSLLRGAWMYFPSLGWRTATMQRIGFRPEYNVVQDLCMVLDILMQGGKLLLDDYATFLYRRHSGSDSSRRALEGTRFDEERAFFRAMAAEMGELGWTRAASVAKRRISSRLHAASLVPKAVANRKWTGVRNLSSHVVS